MNDPYIIIFLYIFFLVDLKNSISFKKSSDYIRLFNIKKCINDIKFIFNKQKNIVLYKNIKK